MSTITISIGRNTNDGGVLSDEDWRTFRLTVDGLAAWHGELVQVADGTGYWQGEEEETHTVSAVGPWVQLDNRRKASADWWHELCQLYRQDCIAVSVHDPVFAS